MLIHELSNKGPVIVPKESPLYILDIKSAVYMAKNGNNTNHNKNIARRLYFMINCEKYKWHKIEWYEWGLQLSDIATKSVKENDVNTRKKKYSKD